MCGGGTSWQHFIPLSCCYHLFLATIYYKNPHIVATSALNKQLPFRLIKIKIWKVKILFYLYFFLLHHSFFLNLVSTFWTRFNISCRAGLLTISSLSFCLFKKENYSLWRIIFLGIELWIDIFFLSTFSRFPKYRLPDGPEWICWVIGSAHHELWPTWHRKSVTFLPKIYEFNSWVHYENSFRMINFGFLMG